MESTTLATRTAGLSGAALKLFACFAMLLDHLAVALYAPLMLGSEPPFALSEMLDHFAARDAAAVYYLLRFAGRLAFPIFCFFIVEGFLHTHDLRAYLLRLAAFALVSEVPFDLAFYDSGFYWGHQNVYLTLFLGLCCIALLRWAGPKRFFVRLASLLGCALLSLLLNTDYQATGVIVIAILYELRGNELLRDVCSGLVLVSGFPLAEWPALLAFAPLHFYNGQRGNLPKWLFYGFYPGHLLLLWLLRLWLL